MSFFAREEGTRTLWCGSSSVKIATFGHRDNRNHWLTVAQVFGGNYPVGPLWIAEVEHKADAQAVQHALGGTIRLKGKQ